MDFTERCRLCWQSGKVEAGVGKALGFATPSKSKVIRTKTGFVIGKLVRCTCGDTGVEGPHRHWDLRFNRDQDERRTVKPNEPIILYAGSQRGEDVDG